MTRGARVAAVAVLGVLALGGCGSASEPSPPTGVDELVVPSPSLDTADFVATIDNTWLPLAPGNRWTYRSTVSGVTTTVIATVLDQTRVVQGVPATVVARTRPLRGGAFSTVYDWYAQDTDGNVWHLGREVGPGGQGAGWEAGVAGAEAGLAMAADPRVGDGYSTGYAPGVAEDVEQVVATDGSAAVPYDDLLDLLETEVTSPLVPGSVELASYARGIGLVRTLQTGEGDQLLELVAFDKG